MTGDCFVASLLAMTRTVINLSNSVLIPNPFNNYRQSTSHFPNVSAGIVLLKNIFNEWNWYNFSLTITSYEFSYTFRSYFINTFDKVVYEKLFWVNLFF